MPCGNFSALPAFDMRELVVVIRTSAKFYPTRSVGIRRSVESLQALGSRVVFHSVDELSGGPVYAPVWIPPPEHRQRIKAAWSQTVEQRAMVHYMLHSTGSAPFIMKADDDTDINATALREVMSCFAPFAAAAGAAGKLYMLGECMKVAWEPLPFCGGGPGMVMPRVALQKASECVFGPDRNPTEDANMSWCMLEAGATLVNNPRMFYWNATEANVTAVGGYVTRHKVWARRRRLGDGDAAAAGFSAGGEEGAGGYDRWGRGAPHEGDAAAAAGRGGSMR